MDYYLEVLRSVDFIERHLTEELSLQEIAAQANLSVPHLYRVFPALVGCTVGQYVRRRRLTEAARLLTHHRRVLDVAFEYQFESQESFTRAFKSLFGLTPGEYKRNPVLIPVHHPILIRQKEKEERITQPEIIVKQFVLLGMETEVDLSGDFAGQIALLTDAVRQRLSQVGEPVKPMRIVNMWYPKFQSDLPTSEPIAMFFTGVEAAPGTVSLEGMSIKALPKSLYAVFEEHQRGIIGGPNGEAYRTWLPNSGYTLNDTIPGDLEEYLDTEHVGYQDVCKIWIPICAG